MICTRRLVLLHQWILGVYDQLNLWLGWDRGGIFQFDRRWWAIHWDAPYGDMFWGWEVDGTDSGSFPVAYIHTSGVDHSNCCCCSSKQGLGKTACSDFISWSSWVILIIPQHRVPVCGWDHSSSITIVLVNLFGKLNCIIITASAINIPFRVMFLKLLSISD
jgi:hypothetical protein